MIPWRHAGCDLHLHYDSCYIIRIKALTGQQELEPGYIEELKAK